jgi:hypothetical protein
MKSEDQKITNKKVLEKLSEIKKQAADKKAVVMSSIWSFLSGLEVGANLQKQN